MAGRKTRVVVVGHALNACVFGAERSLLDVIAAIDPELYELSCVFPARNDAYLAKVARHTSAITVLPYGWWSQGQGSDAEGVARFEALFRALKPDLVHVNTITLLDPLRAARRLAIPTVTHARELIDGDASLQALLGTDGLAPVRLVQEASDFIVANSHATYRLYAVEGRTFHLYNSVDVPGLDLPNPVDGTSLKVGLISGNSPNKGLREFVELARLAKTAAPGLRFCIVGPLSAAEAQMGDREALRGVVDLVDYCDEPRDAVAQVNVVMSLSTAPESFGRSVAEGMAARRPVITYDRGAFPEYIRHGREGYLIPAGDYPAALPLLQDLLADPDLVAAMGRHGRARAAALFEPGRFKTRLNDIYRDILALSGRRDGTS